MTNKSKRPLKRQYMDPQVYIQTEAGGEKCRGQGAKAKRNEVWEGEVEKKKQGVENRK